MPVPAAVDELARLDAKSLTAGVVDCSHLTVDPVDLVADVEIASGFPRQGEKLSVEKTRIQADIVSLEDGCRAMNVGIGNKSLRRFTPDGTTLNFSFRPS